MTFDLSRRPTAAALEATIRNWLAQHGRPAGRKDFTIRPDQVAGLALSIETEFLAIPVDAPDKFGVLDRVVDAFFAAWGGCAGARGIALNDALTRVLDQPTPPEHVNPPQPETWGPGATIRACRSPAEALALWTRPNADLDQWVIAGAVFPMVHPYDDLRVDAILWEGDKP